MENDRRPPPNTEKVIVIARMGFQSIAGVNNDAKALLAEFGEVANGTAGKAVEMTTGQLATLFRDLADILDKEYTHSDSKQKVSGGQSIDQLSVAVQAITPSP